MPCDNCSSVSIPISTANIKAITSQFCASSPCGANSGDATCTIYNGPNLSCTGVYTGNNLEHIIQKFDSILCATTGNYSSYNTYCLDDLNPITSQQQFVESISNYVCSFKETYNTFVNTTFTNYQASVNTRFQSIEVPNVSAPSYVGASPSDTLQQTLTKYSTKLGDLNNRLDISSVNWDNCFTVDPNPTTIPQALIVINQLLCSLKADIGSGGAGTLPLFNNTGSCLATPTASDTLVDTVNKIKTKLCTTPTFDINTLTWSCVTKPSSTTTNLQAAFQAVLTKLDNISQNLPTFTGDFAVTNVDNTAPCLGKRIALTSSPSVDRMVAVNVGDTTPGTLSQKITSGTGITLDTTTSPGTMIINSTASGANDKVKSRSVDSTADYLENKIVGSASSSNGITITTATDASTEKVKIGATLNPEQIWNFLFEALDDFSDLKTAWCTRVQACLPNCIIPPAVSFIINPPDNTTSSTTTSSTTLGGA